MNLVIVSHKPCWLSTLSPTCHVTDGGFPFQVQALSELFDHTTVMLPVHRSPAPRGVNPLHGHNLCVEALLPVQGVSWKRRLSLVVSAPRILVSVWRAIACADAVHAPVPGDIGTLAIIVALLQRKRLFVRYCGIWGLARRLPHRFLFWLLDHIAGGRNVVLATGGGIEPPSRSNSTIRWIFASTMRISEMAALKRRVSWKRGLPLRLITVARQEPGKHTDQLLRALALVRQHYPQTTLDVVGNGSCLPALKQLAAELELEDAVAFHGQVDHDTVIKLLREAHLFCFPTDSEGFPKAVQEALACGLPVVATPVSVLAQLIGSHNGALIQDIQAPTIAQAVLSITTDESRFTTLVENAYGTAQEYSLEAWRDRIGEMLSEAWGPLQHRIATASQARWDV